MKNEFKPDYVTPPYDTLRECINELNITDEEFMRRSGVTKGKFADIVSGKVGAITADTARLISNVVGGSESFWSNRQSQYDEAMARTKRKSIDIVDVIFGVLITIIAIAMLSTIYEYIRYLMVALEYK